MSITPTHADLGIEIGKAQAMAEAAQTTAERMEVSLNDRMDRIEKSVHEGFVEVKELIKGIHTDLTHLKVQDGKNDAKEEAKKHGWSVGVSVTALIVSLVSAVSGLISYFMGKSH